MLNEPLSEVQPRTVPTAAGVEKKDRLPLWIKLVYGSGDWGMASFGTLRQVFYAIFLTDVVGLAAGLASFAAITGALWDAINDPLVGVLTDRLHTRLGRRRPFLLLFSIPYGLGFMLLWWAPPFESPAATMIVVTLAYMLTDTLQTLVIVPYFALTPEITEDYDERTTLTGFRMFFNLLASLVVAVAAPMIVDMALKNGYTQQQGYILVAAIFGGLAAVPFLLIGLFVRERQRVSSLAITRYGLNKIIHTAWGNIPFRFATGLYMLNWITFDLVALMLPFYILYWISSGDLLASVNLFGVTLSLESAVLGLLLVTAVVALPFWMRLSRRLSKRRAYIVGMSFWAVVQLVLFLVQPGQTGAILALSVLAGLGVSTAHVLPDAIFPDCIEWDELRTRQRHEGIYYGVKNFIRKLSGALTIFLALQILGIFGYQAPPEGAVQFNQPDSTLAAIRWLTGPAGALLLLCAITVAWFYPLTRARHARIRRLLERRRRRPELKPDPER
jgi:GPH family glycoside/pentoside/hexuronide:cation symporter